MKTYILFFIVFIISFSAYSQAGGGMHRGGHSGSGITPGTQNISNCNPAGRGPGIDAGGTSATGIRKGTGIGTKISQPNNRTNTRVNTGVRSF